jgi:hypothetical protein
VLVWYGFGGAVMVGVISVFTPQLPPPTFTPGTFVLLVLPLVAVKETQSLSQFCV